MQAYDPLQPINSINTYEAPDRQSTALDDPSALRYNSIIRNAVPNVINILALPKRGGFDNVFHRVLPPPALAFAVKSARMLGLWGGVWGWGSSQSWQY